MSAAPVQILGAGLTGMSAGYHLEEDYEIHEKATEPGGLCVTLEEDGYRFDRTGEGVLRGVYTWVYNALIKALFGVRVRDINFAFKLCRRRIFEHVELKSEGSFIDEHYRADSFESLYSRLLLNYKQLGYPRSRPGPDSPTGAEFLIITHPLFSSAANDLAAWRNSTGIDTEVQVRGGCSCITSISDGPNGLARFYSIVFFDTEALQMGKVVVEKTLGIP